MIQLEHRSLKAGGIRQSFLWTKKNIGIGQVTRSPSLDEEREKWVPVIKEFRKQIDALIQRVPRSYVKATEDAILINHFETHEPRDQVRIHLTNAKMWAGKMLESLGNPFPAELADKANVQ